MHLRLASKPLISELKAGLRLERRLNPELAGAETGGWVPPSEREKKNGAAKSDSGRRRSASPPARGEKYERRR